MTSGPDFDWVKVRSECTPAKVFQRLKLEVKADVDSRNATRPLGVMWAFNTTPAEDSITVFLSGARSPGSVIFEQTELGISVRDGSDKIIFEATLTLNNYGECRLRINDGEYEMWQVRKMALEDLFFNTPVR